MKFLSLFFFLQLFSTELTSRYIYLNSQTTITIVGKTSEIHFSHVALSLIMENISNYLPFPIRGDNLLI